MPCRDDYPQDNTPAEKYINGLDISGFAAALCAVFTKLDDEGKLPKLLARLDWNEAGVSLDQVVKWWEAHKKRDAARIAKEKARKSALAKLTKAERTALGL